MRGQGPWPQRRWGRRGVFYLHLGLFSLPVQVVGLVLLQADLQLVLGLAAARLCSLQLPQQLCTPATECV